MAVARPLIGICGATANASWTFWSQHAVLTAGTYLDAVGKAGGEPLILPPSRTADTHRLLGLIDGLLLTGGMDVWPAHYGEQPSPQMELGDRTRDDFELRLAAAAFDRDVPVLGTSRGLQVLNIATGGTLHQHLLDAGFAEHRPKPGRVDESTNHAVDVEVDSLLGQCGMAGVGEVNSHHHQGVATVGVGGRVTARSIPDGSIEAVEWPAQRFALGVQWHPEDPRIDAMFEALVRAAAAKSPAALTGTAQDPGES
jgi:putative glutamine amidotransferase